MAPNRIQYTRLYTDSDGETHFEDVDVAIEQVDFAPPAPSVGLSAFIPATQWAFFTLPPGGFGDWHPTPCRQIFFHLAGRAEAEVSDGTVRQFGPGDVTLVEDTTGKGHRRRTIGDSTLVLAVMQMLDK